MRSNPTETVWKVFTQVRKFSLQIDVYRSDSFYATLASVLAAGMNNDGSISKYQFWKWFLKNVTFFQKYFLYHSLLKRHLYPDRTNYECIFFLKISARYIADSLLSSQKTSAELSQFKKKKNNFMSTLSSTILLYSLPLVASKPLCHIKKEKIFHGHLSVQNTVYLKAIFIKLTSLLTSCSTLCTSGSGCFACL